MDYDEEEDECQECGFPVNKSKPEDHQYCKVRREANTAVESAPVATDSRGDEEVATENSIDNAEGAYVVKCMLCDAECATVEGMNEHIVTNHDCSQDQQLKIHRGQFIRGIFLQRILKLTEYAP